MTQNEMLDRPARTFQAAGEVNSSAANMIDAILQLKPAIEACASTMEAERRMPPDLLKALRSLGIFRMFVPHSHGGLELDLPSALASLKTLARLDGSVGWTAMIGSGTTLFASLLRRELYEAIYRDSPDMIFAGSSQPAGIARKIDGGWRVTGRWPFASGCQHADWMGGICIMTEDDKPLPGTDGAAPMARFVILPATDWTIEDTWHVAGMRGTGSHDIVLNDRFVADENLVDPADGIPCLSGPLYGGALYLLPLMHSAIAVGMAEGALDDVVTLAKSGRRQQRAATAMQDSEMFQTQLGHLGGQLRAAQALLEVQTASHWRHALAGTLKTPALLTQVSQTAVWMSASCRHIVDACFALAGSAAIYETSPLQRRMRDIHVASQHAFVHQRFNRDAGARLLGYERRSLTIGD